LFTLLALAALTARPPSLPRPMRLLRGCTAILCLLIALGVASLAFIVQR
jgi:hypothetical protein